MHQYFHCVDDDEFEQEEMLMVEWTPDHDNTLSFDIITSRGMIDITITDNDGKSCVHKRGTQIQFSSKC